MLGLKFTASLVETIDDRAALFLLSHLGTNNCEILNLCLQRERLSLAA